MTKRFHEMTHVGASRDRVASAGLLCHR
jgi:hypothetical protein